MNHEEFELIKSSIYNIENMQDAAENPVVAFFKSALLSAVPAVDVAISNTINVVLKAKFECYRNQLLDVILSDSFCVTTEMIHDVEIISNVVKTVNAVYRLATNDKIIYFGNLLRNGYFNNDRISSDKFDEYFNAIETLSYRQLSLLALLYSHGKKFNAECNARNLNAGLWSSFKKEACESFDFSEEELISILKSIEKTGLCKEVVGTFYDYRGGVFEATAILNDFATFVLTKESTNKQTNI